MLEERRSLGGNGCCIEGGIGVSKKAVIVANVNYVSQLLTMQDAQRAVKSVPDQNLLTIIMYNIGE